MELAENAQRPDRSGRDHRDHDGRDLHVELPTLTRRALVALYGERPVDAWLCRQAPRNPVTVACKALLLCDSRGSHGAAGGFGDLRAKLDELQGSWLVPLASASVARSTHDTPSCGS